jgi:hypothetical protein
MKRYLLIAGDNYYPQSATSDWVGCFETYEEAEAKVVKTQEHELFSRGPRKGQIKSTSEYYSVNGRNCDWYEIIDLMEWMNKCQPFTF